MLDLTMKTTLTVATITIFILTIAAIGAVSAQIAVVGVTRGNTLTYSYKMNWNSTDPNAVVPAADVDLNNTNFIQLRIVNVTNTAINIDFVRTFKNGTAIIQNGNVDVNSQIIQIPYGMLIIRANANPNEKVYPAGGHATLNETSLRTYSIGQVETIHYLFSTNSSTYYEKTEIYYDRASGAALEYNFEARETSGTFVATTNETMMITSWAVLPEFPTTVFLAGLLIALSLVAIIAKKRFHTQ
jgi:hypothetical protein